MARAMDARGRAIDGGATSFPGRLSDDDPGRTPHGCPKTEAPLASFHNFPAAGAVRSIARGLAGNGDPGALGEIVLRHHLEDIQIGIDANAPRNERPRQDASVLE